MYSPKISEELIPHLYRRAKKEGIPMTELVDVIIKKHLRKEIKGNEINDERNREETAEIIFSRA
jgi:hypothetical protein